MTNASSSREKRTSRGTTGVSSTSQSRLTNSKESTSRSSARTTSNLKLSMTLCPLDRLFARVRFRQRLPVSNLRPSYARHSGSSHQQVHETRTHFSRTTNGQWSDIRLESALVRLLPVTGSTKLE